MATIAPPERKSAHRLLCDHCATEKLPNRDRTDDYKDNYIWVCPTAWCDIFQTPHDNLHIQLCDYCQFHPEHKLYSCGNACARPPGKTPIVASTQRSHKLCSNCIEVTSHEDAATGKKSFVCGERCLLLPAQVAHLVEKEQAAEQPEIVELSKTDQFERSISDLLAQHRSKKAEYGPADTASAHVGVDPVLYQLARIAEKNERIAHLLGASEAFKTAIWNDDWQSTEALLLDIAGHALLAIDLMKRQTE